jgi:hypothetical protein
MSIFRAWLALALALQASSSIGQQPRNNDKTPVIAESSGVEIQSIKVVRQKVSGAAKSADFTNMELELWIAGDATEPGGDYLVHVTEFSVIEDDAGKNLAPKKRLAIMDFLKAPVPARETAMTRGKAGPVVRFTLDAPEKSATRLKSIKGKAAVSQSSYDRLQFKDLATMQGQSLEHASLSDFPVKATVKFDDGNTTVTLEVPTPHERIVAWGLVKGNRMIDPSSEGEGQTNEEGIATLGATYEGDLVKDCTLGIMLAQPNANRLFEFEFKDVELP